jgi:hypothetical protein
MRLLLGTLAAALGTLYATPNLVPRHRVPLRIGPQPRPPLGHGRRTAHNPVHNFGSAACPAGSAGLSTAAASIGSGSVHTMTDSFHASVPHPGAARSPAKRARQET